LDKSLTLPKGKPFLSPLFLLALGVACVSTAGVIARRALVEATPLAVAAWRLGIAAVFLIAIETVRSRSSNETVAPLTVKEKLRLCLAGVFLALHFLTWFISILYTTVSVSTLLACTAPFWTAIIGLLFFSKKPGTAFWIGLAIAFIGVVLVIGRITGGNRHALIGDLLATASGLIISGYLFCVEGLQHHAASKLVAWTYSSAAVVLWVPFLLTRGISVRYDPPVWGAIVLLAIVPQVIGHTLLNSSLRHFPSYNVSLSLLAEPVITAILAIILLHETVLPLQIVGGLIVLASLGLVLSKRESTAVVEEL
jgi:drug/metabolite transporter (DMT)-like permease